MTISPNLVKAPESTPAAGPQEHPELYETRAFHLKSPTKHQPDSTPVRNTPVLARPRQFAQLAKYSHRVRGVNEDVKQLKTDLTAVKGHMSGLNANCREKLDKLQTEMGSLQGRLDDLESVVADMIGRGQQFDDEMMIVKEWILLFRDHLDLE